MSEARVKVSLSDGGTIEMEGTESFVSAQLDKFGDSIRAGLAGKGGDHQAAAEPPAAAAEDPAAATEDPAAATEDPAAATEDAAAATEDAAGADTLDDIFAATDAGVRILTDIPGYRVYEKMGNAAKLLAYGIARLENRTVVRFAEVTAACKKHRCYDGAHMASALKHQKSAFVFAGRGKKQTLALTASGTSDAEKLIESLRAAGGSRGI